jgi:hypothetical protein
MRSGLTHGSTGSASAGRHGRIAVGRADVSRFTGSPDAVAVIYVHGRLRE